jgi:hypothetical protein
MSNLKIQGNASGAGTTTLQSGNTASSVTFSLPIADGTNGQALITDGSGVLSFSGVGTDASLITSGTLAIARGGTGTTSTTFANLATNVTGTLPVANGGTGTTSTTFANLTTNVTGTLPVANGGTGVTTSTGTTNVVLSNSPTLVTPVLGTPSSGNLNSCTADGTNPVGYRNIPPAGAKTSSYTLTAADIGEFVELGTSGTIVVPASVFAAGDAISIFNNTSASISCTCSAVTTFYKAGTDADINSFSVTSRGVATILFINATTAVVTGNVA